MIADFWMMMGVTCFLACNGLMLGGRQFLSILMLLEMLTLLGLVLLSISVVSLHSFVFFFLLGVGEAAIGLSVMVWLSRTSSGMMV